jgi:hypothetical protein
MADPPQDLLAAVRAQAEARLRMDIQGYADHLTPEAVDSLRASFRGGIPTRVQRYEIVTVKPLGADHIFEVRYSARDDSFVVRSRWREMGDGWKVVHAERLWAEGERRPGFVSRLIASVLGRLVALRRRKV